MSELFHLLASLWSLQLGEADSSFLLLMPDFFFAPLTSKALSDAQGQAVLGPLYDPAVVEDHAGQHHPFPQHHGLISRLLGEAHTPHCNRRTEREINFRFLSLHMTMSCHLLLCCIELRRAFLVSLTHACLYSGRSDNLLAAFIEYMLVYSPFFLAWVFMMSVFSNEPNLREVSPTEE